MGYKTITIAAQEYDEDRDTRATRTWPEQRLAEEVDLDRVRARQEQQRGPAPHHPSAAQADLVRRRALKNTGTTPAQHLGRAENASTAADGRT